MPEMNIAGEPDGGNLHVRFDEGRQLRLAATLRGLPKGGTPTAVRQRIMESFPERNKTRQGA